MGFNQGEEYVMKYCRKCIQPDTRPGLLFNDDNISSACLDAVQRRKIDWREREEELQNIAEWAMNKSEGDFDCVVGVSGGKDSTFQALYAKERLGLKVLLVNCAPDNISEVGRYNLENLVQWGFDMISLRPNPKIERELSKRAFYKYGNFVKPLEFPLYASSFQVALKVRIPLIIQGENPAETLGIVGFLDEGGDAMDWKNGPTVAGGNANDWVQDGVELKDILFYQFPDENKLKKSNIRAIYLGHYVREWSNTKNTEFAISRGLMGRPGHDPNLTGKTNAYFSIDADLKIVNQMLKYLKFGFGAATDEACYDIREGRMSREDGINLVQKYDGKCGGIYIQEWCNYIGISVDEFWRVTDSYVNKKLFGKDEWGKWKPKFKVGADFNEE